MKSTLINTQPLLGVENHASRAKNQWNVRGGHFEKDAASNEIFRP